MTPQLELFNPARAPSIQEVDWLTSLLVGVDWKTAEGVLIDAGLPVTDSAKRRLRLLASMSGGQVAGGQRGYKLVKEMTAEEFAHFQNWMSSQEDEMKRRRIEAQRVFYSTTNHSTQ